MSDENSKDVDLFGDPYVAPKDSRGRKSHKWDRQIAEKVAFFKASRMNVEDIAPQVGLSEPTLRKYYFRELDEGGYLVKAKINAVMYQRALAGNVGAARYLREELGSVGSADTANPVRRRDTKEPALGKKEARLQRATDVQGKYAPPPAPTRLQ